MKMDYFLLLAMMVFVILFILGFIRCVRKPFDGLWGFNPHARSIGELVVFFFICLMINGIYFVGKLIHQSTVKNAPQLPEPDG